LSQEQAGKLTILVVEDDAIVRFTIVEFLRSAECEVVEAASGEAAVSVLQQRDGIDAVFTDIQLGGEVDGWDVGYLGKLIRRSRSFMPLAPLSPPAAPLREVSFLKNHMRPLSCSPPYGQRSRA
jgi:response regulator RpfG family c-di-GMP phosphodiesterase